MRRKKGVSVILGTVLLIIIAVASTAIIYSLYAPALVPTVDTNKMLEEIVISQLDGDGTDFTVYVLNKGKVDVVIDAIYLEDLSDNWESSWNNGTSGVIWPLGGQVAVNSVSNFILSSLASPINDTKIFKAVTTRGTEAQILYTRTTEAENENSPEGGSGANYTQFSITVFKFNDANINGIYDAGESLIPNWRFFLKDALTGQTLSYANTSESGFLVFQDLNKGFYLVEEQPELRNGSTMWFNSTLSSYLVEINSKNETIWIGNYLVEFRYILSGFVFNDKYPDYGNGTKGNGIFDTNETGLGNWTVTCRRLTGIPEVRQAKTQANGYYELTGLANGIYVVTAWQANPLQIWIATNPNPNATTIIDASPPMMNFSFYQVPTSVSNYSTVSGLVFEDKSIDGEFPDGIYNPSQNDTGIPDVTILVYQGVGFGTPFSDWKTNASGNFDIPLIPGIYTIQVNYDEEEWDPTTDTFFVVDLTASNETRNFGLYYNPMGTQTLYITGVFFNDADGDGIWNSTTEPGIPNISIYRSDTPTPIHVTTDANGIFLFDSQMKGNYTVFLNDETLKLQLPGWIVTTYSSVDVSLTTSPVGGIEFGVYNVGVVSGRVYYNADNVTGFDPAFDYPLKDVTILLNGTTSTRTDADGLYIFQGLTPGIYEVQEIPLDQWECVSDRVVVVDTTSNPQTVDFLNRPLSTLKFYITGMVFNDEDRDGINDVLYPGGDSPYTVSSSSQRPYIYYQYANGSGTQSVRAGQTTGAFTIGPLTAGEDYNIYIGNITDKIFTTPQLVLVQNLFGNQTIDFGLYNTSSSITFTIRGIKYNDTSPYGVFNIGDTRITNWGIYLYSGTNVSALPLAQNYTHNGDFFFDNIVPGIYTLVELVEPGWANQTPSVLTFNLTDHMVVDFFNNYTAFSNGTSLYSIAGRTFNDVDNSGHYNLGDGLISNQLVILNDEDGFPIDFIRTSSGWYNFTNLAGGNYSLRVQVPSGYVHTTPTYQPVDNLNSNVIVDFGFRQPAAPIYYTVSGYVFWDKNANGIWEPLIDNESPQSGWYVFLYAGDYSPISYPISITTTNGSGFYSFTGLSNTTYSVVERLVVGWTCTTGREVVFTISGAPYVNASFGNDNISVSAPRYISGFKFNDTDNSSDYTVGEVKLSGWRIWLNDAEGYPIRYYDTRSSVSGNTPIGYYNLTGLPNGDYVAYEQPQSGWTNSTPIVVPVTLSGSSNSSVDFGNRVLTAPTTYLISGYVFNDTNRNNVFDDGGSTMSDSWTIFLYSGSYSPYTFPTAITTTSSGQYTFSGLGNGLYTVVEVLKTGYINLWSRAVSVTISGASMTNQSFFNKWVGPQPTYLVSGYKYNDTDLDQYWNRTIPDEAALSGWQISIFDSFGFPLASATTTSSGYYSFLVPNGVYTIAEDLSGKAGWTYSTPYQRNITVANGTVSCDFGNYQIGKAPAHSVYGWVFNDTNMNTVQDVGEAGLYRWYVYLYNKTGPTTYTSIGSVRTDSNGFYIFPNLPPGSYRVRSLQYSTEYTNTTDTNAYFTLTEDLMQNFGWFYNYTPTVPHTISGRIYNSLNTPANGLANWTVIVTNGTYVNSKLTDSTGNYSFTLADGDYTVQAIVQAGYYNITPSIVNATLLGPREIVDFGMNLSAALPRYTVSGLKFNDLDRNGVQDDGELPIASWGFVLYNTTDIFNAFTNSSGIFAFDGLLAGAYTVNETYRGGWAASTPTSININLASNGTFLTFGNYLNYTAGLNFSISGYVLQNGSGSPLSGWLMTLTDYQGIMIDSQLTGASGNYNFSNLAGGKYTVTSWYDSGAGWKNVTASVVALEITNSSITGLNFYYIYDRYNVSGHVFFDTDKNGVYANTTDLPLPGWQMILRNSLGDTFVTTTDSNGRYSFTAQPPGTYTLSEVLPLGWNATTSSSVILTVTSDQTVNFGNKRWYFGQFLTYDRNMWSADSNGYLQNNISAVYGSSWVVSIGTTAAFMNQWDNVSFIRGYLANANPAAVLDNDYNNPSGALAGQGGVLGANLLALKFNTDYDRAGFGSFYFGPGETLLEDLRIFNYSAAANGKTIGQIFTEANNFIATGSGSMTALQYSTLIARINSAFSTGDYTDAAYFLY